jgi:hypothetical protein
MAEICDHCWHETQRTCPTTGGAAPTRLSLAATRQRADRSWPTARRLASRRPNVASRGQATPTPKTEEASGASVSSIAREREAPGSALAARRTRARLCRRLLDVEAHRPLDRAAVRSALSSQWGLAFAASHEMELPKAAAPSGPTRRRGHFPLAAVSLAADKKSGAASARAWFSWTKVASAWSRRSNALGRRAGTRPASAPACNITSAST